MSFFTHFLLALFLILLTFSPQPKGADQELRRTGIVLASNEADSETEYLDESDLPTESEEIAQQQNEEAASNPPPAPPLKVESVDRPDRPDLPGFEANDSINLDGNAMIEIDSDARFESQFELTPEQLKLIEAEQRLIAKRAPKGDPTTIQVFGSGGLNGRKFVFVLDRSKSMGSSGLGVIQAAKKELSRAISQLEDHHSFQIVGYHERTVTMNQRRLLPATEINKREVANFVGNLGAFGATNHENGLIAAAVFKPDIIVFMTDGGHPNLNDGELKQLKRLFGGAEVHCIQFGIGSNQASTSFMVKLASQNRGSFRYIDVTKWKK